MDKELENFFYKNYNLHVNNRPQKEINNKQLIELEEIHKNNNNTCNYENHSTYGHSNKSLFNNKIQSNTQYYETNIQDNITINLLEAYQGCIKEKVIKRIVYTNDTINNTHQETICIEIPSGILDNECITIKNKGNVLKTNYNNIIGDLIVTVNIEESMPIKQAIQNFGKNINMKHYNLYDNDYFTKSSNNLVLHKTITLKESLCGYQFTLIHLNNKVYKIESPKNTIINPKTETIIPFNGFNRNNNKGELIIKYNIKFPEKLTKEQLLLIEKVFE